MRLIYVILLIVTLAFQACNEADTTSQKQGGLPHQKEGGTLIDAESLKKSIEEAGISDMVGLAFAGKINSNGRLPTVELDILRVFSDGDEKKATKLTGDLIIGGKAMDDFEGIVHPIKDLEFEFSSMVNSSQKFDFGFITKQQYDLLMNQQPEQLFVSGAKVNFGKIQGIVGEYFTFKIEVFPKKLISSQSDTIIIGMPDYQLTIPCPPNWFLSMPSPNKVINYWKEIQEAVNQALE